MGLNISTISNFSCSGRSPNFIRDTTISAIEQDVFQQLNNVLPKDEIIEVIINPSRPTEMKFISVEDAIKELEELEKGRNL